MIGVQTPEFANVSKALVASTSTIPSHPPDEPPGERPNVPGIVGGSIHVVAALEVPEADGQIGLACYDGTRALHRGNNERVFLRYEV